MRLDQALRQGIAGLQGVDGAARDARVLLAAALGVDPSRLTLMPERVCDDGELARFMAMIERRAKGEPVARILGRRAFWGRDFIVTGAVLDPRPETETLIASALEGPVPRRLLDLGTGSGIIAVTLLAEWPDARGVAVDISPEALAVAGRNGEAHGVAERLTLVEGSWFAPVEGRFALIVSNPPYIGADEMPGLSREVRDWDPEIALTPGGDGLDAYRAIAKGALSHLEPGGRILLEIGPTQGAAVSALLAQAGFADLEIVRDMDGRDRVVAGRAPA